MDNQLSLIIYVMHAHRRVLSGWKSSPPHSTAHQPTTTISCTKRGLIFFKALQFDRLRSHPCWSHVVYSSVLPFDLYRKLLVIWNACVDPLTLPHLFLRSLLHYAVVLETIQRDGLEPRGHFEVCSTRSSYRLLKISYAVVWFVVHWACRPKLITIHTHYIQILLYPAICPATGPEPAILDWYGHCGVKKLGGSGGMLPQENFKIRHSESLTKCEEYLLGIPSCGKPLGEAIL